MGPSIGTVMSNRQDMEMEGMDSVEDSSLGLPATASGSGVGSSASASELLGFGPGTAVNSMMGMLNTLQSLSSSLSPPPHPNPASHQIIDNTSHPVPVTHSFSQTHSNGGSMHGGSLSPPASIQRISPLPSGPLGSGSSIAPVSVSGLPTESPSSMSSPPHPIPSSNHLVTSLTLIPESFSAGSPPELLPNNVAMAQLPATSGVVDSARKRTSASAPSLVENYHPLRASKVLKMSPPPIVKVEEGVSAVGNASSVSPTPSAGSSGTFDNGPGSSPGVPSQRPQTAYASPGHPHVLTPPQTSASSPPLASAPSMFTSSSFDHVHGSLPSSNFAGASNTLNGWATESAVSTMPGGVVIPPPQHQPSERRFSMDSSHQYRVNFPSTTASLPIGVPPNSIPGPGPVDLISQSSSSPSLSYNPQNDYPTLPMGVQNAVRPTRSSSWSANTRPHLHPNHPGHMMDVDEKAGLVSVEVKTEPMTFDQSGMSGTFGGVKTSLGEASGSASLRRTRSRAATPESGDEGNDRAGGDDGDGDSDSGDEDNYGGAYRNGTRSRRNSFSTKHNGLVYAGSDGNTPPGGTSASRGVRKSTGSGGGGSNGGEGCNPAHTLSPDLKADVDRVFLEYLNRICSNCTCKISMILFLP